MMLDIGSVPTISEPPANARPSRVWTPFEGWSRRGILAAMGGVVVASGMGVLDLLPWSRPSKAFALTEWSGCDGYWSNNTVTCVPTTAYYGSDNCSGSWHKDEGRSGTCYNYRYTPNPTSCGGKNAWRWGGSSARGNHRKCSDGHYEYHDCGGGNISNFSICRTAIA